MKVLIIECDAEELRANRTVLDNITEAISSFTESFAGARLNNKQIAAAFAEMADKENEEAEDDQTDNSDPSV